MTKQSLLIMAIISALISALFFIAASLVLICTEPERMEEGHTQWQGIQRERGARLYALHCTACHGNRGEGVGQLGPPLSNEHFFTMRLHETGWTDTLEEYIRTTTQFGRMMGTRPFYAGNGSTAVMPPWSKKHGGPLGINEIESLTAFVLNWQATATGLVELAEVAIPLINKSTPQVLTKGRTIFRKKCASCHRFTDRQLSFNSSDQREKGPDLSAIRKLAPTRVEGKSAEEYIQESLLIPAAYVVQGFEEASHNTPCGPLLTVSELQTIRAFILQ